MQRDERSDGCRYCGVYPARVVDIVDLDGEGRVRVRLKFATDAGGSSHEAWARLATLMAGPDRGTWFIPEVGDEVLVSFEAGELTRPYVLGALWNSGDPPPESMDDSGDNNLRVIHSRNAVRVAFDDTPGSERLVLETPGGQKVILEDGPGKVTVQDTNGNQAVLESGGVTVISDGKTTLNAATVEVNAGMVTVNAGLSRFSGVVQADTVITNSVVSASYTPGVGNIW